MHPYVHIQRGKGLGEGWTGSLGLTNANYYIEYTYFICYIEYICVYIQSEREKVDKQQDPTLYTGNYIQCPLINHNEKEYE